MPLTELPCRSTQWERAELQPGLKLVYHFQAPVWHGGGEEKDAVCAKERDHANNFYNENYKNNPFGNLIDYRVYLSMWVLKKNRQYFLKIKKNDLQIVF